MFPLTSSRETSGLSRKQNELFPSGPYIKCILLILAVSNVTCVLHAPNNARKRDFTSRSLASF